MSFALRTRPRHLVLLAVPLLLAGCVAHVRIPTSGDAASPLSARSAVRPPTAWAEAAYDPSEKHLRHAARHREHTYEHERVAHALAAFDVGACENFSATARVECPLFGEVERITDIPTGVRIEFAAGVPIEAVVEHVRCHIAFAGSHPSADVPTCPLYIADVHVTQESHAIVLEGFEPDVAAEIRRRIHLEDDAAR